jgi:hypothetical protein
MTFDLIINDHPPYRYANLPDKTGQRGYLVRTYKTYGRNDNETSIPEYVVAWRVTP